MSKMVGERIQDVAVSVDRGYLKIVTDRKTRIWYADGDCCSRTWIDDVSGAPMVRGRCVVRVDEPPVEGEPPAKRPPESPDVISYYRTDIVTDGGTLVIDYRNESNGCYGGYLMLMANPPPNIDWIEVME